MDALNQLAIVWAAVFAAYILARKTRLTPVLWYLAMGALLVNLGVLPVEPDPFVSGLGEVGIVLIMFALGFEERTSNFLDSIRKSWGIALFGALAPFVTAYTVADYFFQDKTVSLICGLAMTATAVSLTMVSLRELGLHRTPAATRIMTSAVLDSIASLALVA
ncbi:MAG: cation:proton antiporter, partial [Alphaproteobacteria bacterium]